MGKLFWLGIVLFVLAAFYVLISVFAPTGETVVDSGVVVDVSADHFWFAGTDGFSRVITTKGLCGSVPAGVLKIGQRVEVKAKVTDSFQMSVCEAMSAYVKVNTQTYPKYVNEPPR